MSGPFAYGVSALDDALIALPVFVAEKGLSHRRSKLEWIFAKAARAWVEDAVDQGLVARGAVKALLDELPEFDKDKRMIIR